MMYSYYFLAVCASVIFLYYLSWPVILYLQDPLRLRRYPSPNLFASLSSLWLVKVTWSQRRSRILHDEFLRLGDVIRVAPNHIIFNNPAAIKDIYGVLALSRGVAKDAFYDRVAGDAHDLVQIRDRGEHSDRRKAIANAFAAKTVINMESVIRKHAMGLFNIIDRHIDGQSPESLKPLNLRHW